MNTTKREKTIKELFIGQCWEYLHDNFHKFNQTNKIKIALELCKKDIPQELAGNFTFTKMGDIKVNDPVKNRLLEFNIG